MKQFFWITSFLSILLVSKIVLAWSCTGVRTATFLENAEAAYRQRLDFEEAKKALELFTQASQADPTCAEAFANAAKAAWWVGDSSPIKKDKMSNFQKGIDLAKQAIQLDPKSALGHFWLAGNYGSYGETRGVLKSLFLVKPIRKELNDVLAIDPNFEGGAAYRVLGVVDYKVPGFAGGNHKRAQEQLQKAYSIDGTNPITLYYLAEYYSVMGDKQKEAEYLDLLDAMSPTEQVRPDWVRMVDKGKILRSKLKPN